MTIDTIRIKLVCSSCGYVAGECTSIVRDFICRFCIDEAKFFVDAFTIGPYADALETITENADNHWDRHKEMFETKKKINQIINESKKVENGITS